MVRFATEMRSPESAPGHRPGRTFEEELNLRYLSPGAFTVLGPEDRGLPPEPTQPPPVYRLSPNARRHRNQAFSIIAEPLSGRSRSPSPTSGRVSPFRGRGFNPTGSRHTSPAPSPPPLDKLNNNQYPINIVNRPTNVKKSQIPQLKRRDIIFTEDGDESPKYQRKNGTNLKPQLSKSLNNIGPKKPPIIPARRHPGVIAKGVNGGGFSRLSPIIGSSPEPSSDTRSQPSPGSRIPKSRSTPPSRKHSPNRESSPDYNGNRTYLDHRGKPRQREPDSIDYKAKGVNFEDGLSSSREGSPGYHKRGKGRTSRESSPEYHKKGKGGSSRDGSPEYHKRKGASRESSPEYQRRGKGSSSREHSPSRRKHSDSREHSPVRGSKHGDHSPSRSKKGTSSREHSPGRSKRDRSPSKNKREHSPSRSKRDHSSREHSPSRSKHVSSREHSPSRRGPSREHSPSRRKYPNSREHSPLRNTREYSPSRSKHATSREYSPVRKGKHDYSPTRSRYSSPSRKNRASSPSKDRSPTRGRSTKDKRRGASPSRDRYASPPSKHRETSSSPSPSSPEYKKSSSRDQSPENRDSSRPSSENQNHRSPEHPNRRRKMEKNSNVKGKVNPSSRQQSPLDSFKSPVTSRVNSRNPSPSTSKSPLSPTRIPIRNYKNVQSKVNSYAKTTTTNNASKTTNKPVPNNSSNVKRTESVKNVSKPPPKTQTLAGKLGKTSASNTNLNKTGAKNTSQSNLSKPAARTNTNTSAKKSTTSTKVNKGAEVKPSDNQKTKAGTTKTKTSETLKKTESSAKLNPPAVPSSNTSTSNSNTEAKTETKLKETPMYMDEGRVLSATSVSSAIERMNDTVLDSQTLLKDHNISKLSPNPEHKLTTNTNNTVVSLANQNNPNNTAVPSVETNPINSQINNVSNSVSNENNVANNSINKLISPDDSFGAKVNNNSGFQSANDRIKEARTMVASDVKPIRITVQEKADGVEVQSGNVRFPASVTNGVAAGSGGAPPQGENGNGNGNPPPENSPPKSRCQMFMEKVKNKMPCSCCKPKEKKVEDVVDKEEKEIKGCFPCCKKNKKKMEVEQVIITKPDEMEEAKKSFMERLKCCNKGNKVGDSTTGCCGRGRKKDSWEDRRDSILSVPTPLTKGAKCKNFLKMLFCCGCCACTCCKKKTPPPKMLEETSASRRASMMSKKKSLTPTVLPPEEPKNKLDTSLVEFTSTMKAAIPVLPVALAYICCFFNIFAPGTGTVFSGLFCLCMGIPRFSQRDGPKPRLGAFIINIIIGCGQLFTVLFCLVGWGWSIWWGVIMVKIAKKYKKLKKIEERLEAQEKAAAEAEALQKKRDAEKGRA